MPQRVLFHPSPTAEWAKSLQVDALGRAPKGAWLAASDADALELLKRDRLTAMLYPSREAYDEAMEALPGPQIAEAVEKRLKTWTSEAESWILPHLFEREKGFLRRLGGNPSARAFLEPHLAILDKALIEGRYRNWQVTELLEALFEDLNYLIQDLESLEGRFGGRLPPQPAGLKAARLEAAVGLERALQRHGRKQGVPATGRVHANIKRGALIAPLDKGLVDGLEDAHRPVQAWKDGFVTPWEDWDLENLESRGKRVEILYFSEDGFLGDFLPLTPAQRARRLEKAAGRAATTGPADHLADLQVAFILTAGNAGRRLAGAEAGLAEQVARLRQSEVEALGALLAQTPGAQGRSGGALAAEAEAGAAEAAFWLSWSAASRWMDIQEDLEKVLLAKRDQASALRKAGLP